MSTLVLVGAQWGDEGKGKIVDYLSEEADMVVRYQGGANAGHTVVIDGKQYKLHLIPSGLLNDKLCVIGNGVVVDPAQLLREMDALAAEGFDISKVFLSDCAHVIMPYHKMLDVLEEEKRGDRRLGTTGRGIGPAYRDKFARAGIRVGDLLDSDTFRFKLEEALAGVNPSLERVHGAEPFDSRRLYEEYMDYAERLRPFVTDTSLLVNRAIDDGRRVLFEGAQGTLLDIDHGTYPYVTSSHPVAGGACIGAGVGPTRINSVVGVAKAYVTRVGDGPFPTELRDETGEWLRERGREYGTTTGRPRRCGWLDAVALRYAVRINGLSGLALTKVDTLSGLPQIKVCVGYRCKAPAARAITEWPHTIKVLQGCEPLYETLPGWDADISACRSFDELPEPVKRYVAFIEEQAGVPVVLVSVGPDRQQTLMRRKLF